MAISLHLNARRNRNVDIANRSFENMNYFGTAVTKITCITN